MKGRNIPATHVITTVEQTGNENDENMTHVDIGKTICLMNV